MLNWILNRFTATEAQRSDRQIIDRLEFQMELLKQENSDQDELLASYMQRVDERDATIAKLKQELTHKTDLEASQRESKERAQARVAELEKLGECRRQTIYALRVELAEMREVCDSWQTRVNEADELVAELSVERDESFSQRDSWITSANERMRHLHAIYRIVSRAVTEYPQESPIGDSVASCAELAEEDFVVTEREAKVVDAIRAGDSVGEETQVFDSAAVKLPDGFVDSAGYGEA